MKSSDETAALLLEKAVLLALLIGISVALGWILLPFYAPILWACVIAMLFGPLYRRLLPPLRRKHTLAALLTLLIALVIVVLPFGLVTASLLHEVTQLYQRIQSGELKPALFLHGMFDALPGWARAVLDRFGLVSFNTLQRRLEAAQAQGTQFIATQALSIGQNTFEIVAGVFVTMYLAFFMIRDGDAVVRGVRRTIPLAPEHTQALIDRFTTVIRATVKGHLLVAAVQGVLGGFAFWFVGVGAPLLWATLMAFLSLVPIVGAGLVWLPVALYFLLTGAIWQGLSLIAWGALVIGMADNVLRPMLVGKDTRLPDYVVMITTLGGIAVFGINGLMLGPAIAAMFVAVWHLEALAVQGSVDGALPDRHADEGSLASPSCATQSPEVERTPTRKEPP